MYTWEREREREGGGWIYVDEWDLRKQRDRPVERKRKQVDSNFKKIDRWRERERERERGAVIIFTNPSAWAGYDTRSIFKRSLTGLNSEFFFSKTSCPTKAKEFSLPYYLPIAGGRIIGFIPFPRVLVLCEMQSVSSMVWTRVAVSISYDDNHYITGSYKRSI